MISKIEAVDYDRDSFVLMIKGLIMTANYMSQKKPPDEFNKELLSALDFVLQNIIELIASLMALLENRAEGEANV